MPRTLTTPAHGTASPTGGHHDLEDQAVLDFLRGDYTPPAPRRPRQTDPRAAPPVVGRLAYRADTRPGYAIVQYDTASRVHWVIAPFADALSAEHYAIDNDLTQYDVVSATPVIRGTP
jgi:hypothetical protein